MNVLRIPEILQELLHLIDSDIGIKEKDNLYQDFFILCERNTKMKKGMISVLSAVVGAAIGAGTVGKTVAGGMDKTKSMSDKHLALFLMMNQWVKVKQGGKNLAEYFKGNSYKKIAIYGMSYAGETLVDELRGTEVKVVYGIDKNADTIYSDVDVLSMEDDLAKVDAVVVTAITFFDEIKEKLLKKLDCPILSLEDILYEI